MPHSPDIRTHFVADVISHDEGTSVLFVFEDSELSQPAKDIDIASDGTLSRILKKSDFTGKKDTSLLVWLSLKGNICPVLCLGIGEKTNQSSLYWQERGAFCWTQLIKKSLPIWIDLRDPNLSSEAICSFVAGLKIRSFHFNMYKTQTKEDPAKGPCDISILVSHLTEIEKEFKAFEAMTEGNHLTRQVVSEPPNILYPETMAQEAHKLESLGVEVEVLGEAKMRELGMNALLGVGQGSCRESKLVILQWMNGPKNQAPLAFVGKGVTFDTGGISIKPSANMDDMKYDMAGSGVVLGLFHTLAKRKARVNAVGILGMVENMPSGTAQRPADIVTSMSGQTIEVLNTDAEGRLVLADALWYTQDRFQPQRIIDLATLTGAIVVSLGHEYAGLFSNNDSLSQELIQSGEITGEKLWRFPLHENYDKDIDSDVADVKNIGGGRGAGSITAAQFLQRFVNKIPWAHLDIAGTAWDKKNKPLTGKGATGFGVRLLDCWVRQYEE